MSRNEVTEKIITAKVLKGISWASVAERVGQSKEWTTAACLGQMTFTSSQAAIVASPTTRAHWGPGAVASCGALVSAGTIATASRTQPKLLR